MSIKIKNDIENKPELGYQLISRINHPDLCAKLIFPY